MNLTERAFRQEAVIIALNKLFSDNWFSVSQLNSAAVLAEIIIPAEKQKIFQAIHCVHYNAMSKEFREDLSELIHSIFKDFFDIESHQIKFETLIREIEFIKK